MLGRSNAAAAWASRLNRESASESEAYSAGRNLSASAGAAQDPRRGRPAPFLLRRLYRRSCGAKPSYQSFALGLLILARRLFTEFRASELCEVPFPRVPVVVQRLSEGAGPFAIGSARNRLGFFAKPAKRENWEQKADGWWRRRESNPCSP